MFAEEIGVQVVERVGLVALSLLVFRLLPFVECFPVFGVGLLILVENIAQIAAQE